MEKLTDSPEEQENWRKSVTTAAVKYLTAAYSHDKNQSTSPPEQEEDILTRLQHLLVGLISPNVACDLFLLCIFYHLIPPYAEVT